MPVKNVSEAWRLACIADAKADANDPKAQAILRDRVRRLDESLGNPPREEVF